MTYTPPIGMLRAGSDLGFPQTLYVPGFLGRDEADALFAQVMACANWRRERFTMFGREVAAPRLTAWYGDDGTSYRYSGVDRPAEPWLPPIRELACRVARALACPFNYVLVNRYRDGSDTLGWHADDESDLGGQPVIAAVSVGSERLFRLRRRAGGASVGSRLGHGSLTVMWGDGQRDYKHCVPRTRSDVGERLSFTFRLTCS